MTDPAQAAARDEQMLKAEGRPELALPPVPPPVLGPGVLHSGPDGSPVPPAGELSWQGRVIDADGRAGRLDEVVGTGWVVLTAADPTPALTDDARSTLTRLGAVLVHVTAGAAPRGSRDDEVRVVRDVDGSLLPRLRAAGHEILVIRPDFYVFGAGTAVDDLPSLLTELIERLHLRQPAGHPAG
jgi:flavoprotein hydroxylase